MKKTVIKSKRVATDKNKHRPQTSPLNTEERLTVLANLIIDKLMDKYSKHLPTVNKSV